MSQNPNRRSKPDNKPAVLLTSAENKQLFQMIGSRCVSLASAVVQLLFAEGPNHSQWVKKCCGVACFIKDNLRRSYFIRIFDFKAGTHIWEQEIYNQFKYKGPKNFFHTFDTEDCPAGLSFASEDEANSFKLAITDKLSERSKRREEKKAAQTGGGRGGARSAASPRPNQPPAPSPAMSAPISQSTSTPTLSSSALAGSGGLSTSSVSLSKSQEKKSKKDKDNKKKKLTKAEIGAPTDFRHVTHVGWDPDKGGFDMDRIDPDVKELFESAGVTENMIQDKETAKFIYGFLENAGGLEGIKKAKAVPPPPPPPHHQSPSYPSVNSGAPPPPPSRSLGAPPPPPPSRAPASQPPPPPPSRGPMGAPPGRSGMAAPPPPPPSRNFGGMPPPPPPPSSHPPSVPPPPPPSSGPAPPPPPPPPPIGGPPAPAPPPPPPMGGGGFGAPPPPPSGPPLPAAPQDGRGDLLASIRGGAQLKKVDPVAQKPAAPSDGRSMMLDQIRQGAHLKKPSERHSGEPPAPDDDFGLAGALRRALTDRANQIQGDDEDDDSDAEEDDDDDWD